MIINGGSRSNSAWFAKHLSNAEDNERITICEIKNLTANTIDESFREMAAIASATRCKNWFYHVNINPRDGELLTDKQWETAVNKLETNLGLNDRARFIVEHKKLGRTHRHIIWLRIDSDKLKAVEMTNDYAKHQETARALEREFNLKPEKSVLGDERSGPRPQRRAKNWETFRGKKSGISPEKVTKEITEFFNSSKTGKQFVTRLKEYGYALAKGDTASFCVIDQAGDAHSLGRRVIGSTAEQIKKLMRDIDQASLPTVSEARILVTSRNSSNPA